MRSITRARGWLADDAKRAPARTIAVAEIAIIPWYEGKPPRHCPNKGDPCFRIDAWIGSDQVEILALGLVAHGQQDAPRAHGTYPIAGFVFENDMAGPINGCK
jgi:hypothetical protein